ncbi:hypothetical protein Hanom_Chr04g00368241 [Helianthus anomalus]
MYVHKKIHESYLLKLLNWTPSLELIAKIVPEVWARLSFSSKITLLYHFAPHVCNFLPFLSKCLTKLLYTV